MSLAKIGEKKSLIYELLDLVTQHYHHPFDGPSFTVLKKADVDLMVGGKPKTYSVVIKVLPTDDHERHTSRKKFLDLLKFSKEVQVYGRVLRYTVKARYTTLVCLIIGP